MKRLETCWQSCGVEADAEMLDFRRISVFGGLSGERGSHVGDRKPCSEGPDFGIIESVACRSNDYGVK